MTYSSRYGQGYGQGYGLGYGPGAGAGQSYPIVAVTGPTKLSPSLTINSLTPTALYRYRGNDATASVWVNTGSAASSDLSVVGTGGAPSPGQATAWTDGTTGVLLGGQSWAGPIALANDDGTSDQIIEQVFRAPAVFSANYAMISHSIGVSGFLMHTNTSGLLRTVVWPSVTTVGTLAGSGVYHSLLFIDRSGNTRSYLNGTFVASAATGAPSQANAAEFRIGSYGATGVFGYPNSGTRFDLVQGWFDAGICSGTTAEQDSIAAARYTALTVP